MIMKDDALQSLIGGAGWGVKGDTIIYNADAPREPSDEEIDAEVIRLQGEFDALEYARTRATTYPSIGDQLDMQYHDQVNGTTTWKDAIAKVKADNPKTKGK